MRSQWIKAYFEQSEVWGSRPSHYQTRVISAIAALLDEIPGKIFEIGPGKGFLRQFLYANFQNVQYFCADFALNVAGEMANEAIVARLSSLPFKDNTFDVAIASDILEHVPEEEYKDSIGELFRVSAKTVIVSTPFLENLNFSTTQCRSCLKAFHINHHQRSYSIENYEQMAPTGWVLDTLILSGDVRSIRTTMSVERARKAGEFLHIPSSICPYCGHRGGSKGVVLSPQLQTEIKADEYRSLMDDDAFWAGNVIENNEIVARFSKQRKKPATRLIGDANLPLSIDCTEEGLSWLEVLRNEIRLDIPSVFSFKYVRDNATQNYYTVVGKANLQIPEGVELSNGNGSLISCFPNFHGLYVTHPENLEIEFVRPADGTVLKIQTLNLRDGKRVWANEIQVRISNETRQKIPVDCSDLISRGFCFKIQVVAGSIIVASLKLQATKRESLGVIHWPDEKIIFRQVTPVRDNRTKLLGIQNPRMGSHGILPREFFRLANRAATRGIR